MSSQSDLIRTIYVHGSHSGLGMAAITELVMRGESALDAFLQSQSEHPKSDLRPRDLGDTISAVYSEFAKLYPDALIDRFESGRIDQFSTYWALGSATEERSVDILLAGLQSKDKLIDGRRSNHYVDESAIEP